jgi:hypothetical protein
LTEYDCPLEHHQCPQEIYDMLTRFKHCEESAHAKAWRDRVERWHQSLKATHLKHGEHGDHGEKIKVSPISVQTGV